MENLQEIQIDNDQTAYEFDYKNKVYRLKLSNDSHFMEAFTNFSCYDASESGDSN